MYQCAVLSERAKMGRLAGLDTGEAHLPVKDLPMITPLETRQVNSKLIKLQLASLTILRYPGLSSPNLEQPSPSVLNVGKNVHLSFLLISTLIFKQPPPQPPKIETSLYIGVTQERVMEHYSFLIESTQCKTIITVRTIKSINQPSPFIKLTIKNELLHLNARHLNYIRVFIYSLFIPYFHIGPFHLRGR